MDLNNCLKSSVYILRIQVWGFVAIHFVMRLRGYRGTVMLLVCHPLSPCCAPSHSHACKIRVRQMGEQWSRVIDIQYCKEYGQVDRDLTIVSDIASLCEFFAGLIYFQHLRIQLTRLVCVQCKVSLLEFHTLSLVIPWTLRMRYKSS